MQDRIVRTCALEHVTTLKDVRVVLQDEIHRYNYLQVHSTTKEIPAVRFEKSKLENKSVFRPFALPKYYASTKDIFCIRHKRIADGYRKVSIAGQVFQISCIELRKEVEIHLVPDVTKNNVEIRFWAHKKLLQKINLPISAIEKAVHY